MDREDKEQIYLDALDKWGSDAQISQLQEDCVELVVGINNWRRGRTGPLQVLGKLADVAVRVEQTVLSLEKEEYIIEENVFEKLKIVRIERLMRKIEEENG